MSVATSATFAAEVIQQPGFVLVDFWANWCGPCLMLSPLLEEISRTHHLKLVTIDVDTEANLAQKYNVQSLPTVIVFRDGVVKKSLVGVQPQKVYLEALQ